MESSSSKEAIIIMADINFKNYISGSSLNYRLQSFWRTLLITSPTSQLVCCIKELGVQLRRSSLLCRKLI